MFLFDLIIAKFLHDLTNLAAIILGDSTLGSHLSVLTDILDFVPEKELYVFMLEAVSCTVGLANGLARSYYTLASVTIDLPSLTAYTTTHSPTSSTFYNCSSRH
jgi:hypothetical protein